MSPDEARDLFSEAYDEALDGEAKARFDEALLGDDALRAEWEDFRALFSSASVLKTGDFDALDDLDDLDDDALAALAEAEGDDDIVVPDLLHGVQRRIRERSRGRFYRDRFAQRQNSMGWTPLLLAAVMLVVLAAAWLGMTFVQVAP